MRLGQKSLGRSTASDGSSRPRAGRVPRTQLTVYVAHVELVASATVGIVGIRGACEIDPCEIVIPVQIVVKSV
jgi:hypothetical protein